MSTPFINYLLQFEPLSESEQRLILAQLKLGRRPANSVLLRPGEVSQYIYFIHHGVVGDFFYDQQGNQVVKNFHAEHQFLVDLASYQQNRPSEVFFQALTELEFCYFSKRSDQLLTQQMPKWASLVRRISDYLLAKKLDSAQFYLHSSAEQRYQHFLQAFPNLEQRVQLGHIASFLGIAQPSLSRIRKKLALI